MKTSEPCKFIVTCSSPLLLLLLRTPSIILTACPVKGRSASGASPSYHPRETKKQNSSCTLVQREEKAIVL